MKSLSENQRKCEVTRKKGSRVGDRGERPIINVRYPVYYGGGGCICFIFILIIVAFFMNPLLVIGLFIALVVIVVLFVVLIRIVRERAA